MDSYDSAVAATGAPAQASFNRFHNLKPNRNRDCEPNPNPELLTLTPTVIFTCYITIRLT